MMDRDSVKKYLKEICNFYDGRTSFTKLRQVAVQLAIPAASFVAFGVTSSNVMAEAMPEYGVPHEPENLIDINEFCDELLSGQPLANPQRCRSMLLSCSTERWCREVFDHRDDVVSLLPENPDECDLAFAYCRAGLEYRNQDSADD